MRRKQTIDEAFMENLYEETSALYRLDQIESADTAGERRNLGALPMPSVVLLSVLAGAWVLIILYVVFSKVNARRNRQ